MSLPNVNDRSNLRFNPQPEFPENLAQGEIPEAQDQSDAVPTTRSTEVRRYELDAAPTQTLDVFSEPSLTSVDNEADFEVFREVLLHHAQKGKLIDGFNKLLEDTCKRRLLSKLALLLQHNSDVIDCFIRRGCLLIHEKSLVAIPLKHQWLDGVNLMLKCGESLPLSEAMENENVSLFLSNEKLLEVILSSFDDADRTSLLNRLLEASIESDASKLEVNMVNLTAMGANIFSKPSIFVLQRWGAVNRLTSDIHARLRRDGYAETFESMLDESVDHHRDRSDNLKSALNSPCMPDNLLEYACQRGRFDIVKQTLEKMKPGSAKHLAKSLMFHVISGQASHKNYAEFTRLLLNKVISIGYDEGHNILNEWLLASALYRNSEAWSALVAAGANASCLMDYHPNAVIDKLIGYVTWSDIGFFLIENGGYWLDGPNDGNMRGLTLAKLLFSLDENMGLMHLLDVVTCADLLRHQQISIIEQPSAALGFVGKPLHMTGKEEGFDSFLKEIVELRRAPWNWALGWRDTGMPVAILAQVDKLLIHLQVWNEILALDADDSEQRWQRAVLWFVGALHENLDFSHLYKKCGGIRGKPRALLSAFAFQTACDLSTHAKARLKEMDKAWRQLPEIAIRYAQAGVLDEKRLSKRLQKSGLFEPNAVRITHALALAYKRAAGRQATSLPQGTISEQMVQAQQFFARAIADEFPACLAEVSKSWAQESGRAMPNLMERYHAMPSHVTDRLIPLAESSRACDEIRSKNSQMLVDMVSSQFDDLLEGFGLHDTFAVQRKEQAASWREKAVAAIHQNWLEAEYSSHFDEDSDASSSEDSEDSEDIEGSYEDGSSSVVSTSASEDDESEEVEADDQD